MSLQAPGTVEGVYPEDAYMPGVSMLVQVKGDLKQLDGKAVYVVVDSPASLLEPGAFVSVWAESMTDATAAVNLRGVQLKLPGRYQGDLTAHVCLDIACNTRLAGSPLRVPYDVTVLPGMQLDRQTMAVTVPFGQVPSAESVAVGLPRDLVTWGASRSTPHHPYLPSVLTVSPSTHNTGTGTVSLQLLPAQPGTYQETALVFTNITTAAGVTHHYEKTVTVTYTVTPEPAVTHVFWPASGSFVRRQGDALFAETFRQLVTNAGVDATWRGIEYLSYPAAAAGHRQLANWWSEFPTPGTSTCHNTIDASDCLPPGTYTARVRYTVTRNGVDQDVYWPITMQIVGN